MLNEERVRLMVKLASYEQKEGKDDFKVSSYYRKDYVSLNAICTFLWTTVGFAVFMGLLGIVFMEPLLDNLTLEIGILLVAGIILSYVLVVLIYGIVAQSFYNRKHNRARRRVKQYSHNLLVLNKLYRKEQA